jgi:ketosteroid isomerase-like protein
MRNEVGVTTENPNSPDREEDKPLDEAKDAVAESSEIEEFFQRLPGNFRWPKPNAEAVAAAVEAIQRMSGGSAAAEDLKVAGGAEDSGKACAGCGGLLPASARFCVWCGIPSAEVANAASPSQSAAGQHHFHHHYHHIVPGTTGAGLFSSGHVSAAGAPAADAASTAPRGRAPGSSGTALGGRAEATARQVVQDWAQACNTKHIDDLLELYAADATVIRSSVPPIRSLPAIREFLISLLEAGLGDVEMESLRLEILGEIALDLGRCKMLVPIAMGKRREERGKYLVVLVRQPTGTWKILADCWSSDLAVSAAVPEAVSRKGAEPVPALRKPR